MTPKQNIFLRFFIYQKERFPILAHGILISAFTFSAMSFSNICRVNSSKIRETFENGFISLNSFFNAFVNTFLIFLLLRISDEFKDKEYDLKNRPHLPVPRGLVSLSELKYLGIFVFVFLCGFNIVFASQHLIIFVFVLLYMFVMFHEFFIASWLHRQPLFYVVSHMLIIPLVDTLASSFDWMGSEADITGLIWFFAVSFFNGCTLELGRKIKNKENEESNSYSLSLGFDKAMNIFQMVLFVTFCLCIGAALYAQLSLMHHLIFVVLYIFCAIFGFRFKKNRNLSNAKWFERLSGIWAVLMYINLGTAHYF